MKITIYSKNLIFITTASIILILSVFSIVRYAPALFTRKVTGSFEYVRKGEALMRKEKYAEAVKYYEMAFESSPENDEIKNGLVYAYTTYAVRMAADEKYDTGIQYLFKAFDIMPSGYTRRNLSLMYAKKALLETRVVDWRSAHEDLNMAREVAGDSIEACRGLGISLFNDAVGEFKALREDAAVLLAKEAALVYADSRIYEFLGDIYYKKSDLEKSRFYLDKAHNLDPDNNKLAEKHDKIMKEEALSADKKAFSLPYFDIRYEKTLPIDIGLTSKVLEKAYFDVGKDLSYFPSARTTVFFYSEDNFREIFKVRDLVMAFYDGNIRMPLADSHSIGKEAASYLYHEYTHAIVSAKTNNNCPVWLSEGMAVYEEFKWTRVSGVEAGIMLRAIDSRDISVEALDKAFMDPETSPEKLILSYILARTAVEYMVDNWGMKGLNDLLVRIALGRHVVNAIDDEFLLGEKEFNARWSGYVKKKYGAA